MAEKPSSPLLRALRETLIYLSARPNLSRELKMRLEQLIATVDANESIDAAKIDHEIRELLFKLEVNDHNPEQEGRERVLRRLAQNLVDFLQQDTQDSPELATEFTRIREELETQDEIEKLKQIQQRVLDLAVHSQQASESQQRKWLKQVQELAAQTLELLRDPDEEFPELNQQIDAIVRLVQKDIDLRNLQRLNRRLKILLREYPPMLRQSRRERQELLQIIATLIEALKAFQMGSDRFATGVHGFLEELKKTRDLRNIHRLRDALIQETRQILSQVKSSGTDSQQLHQRLLETQSRILVLEDELHNMRQRLAEALRAKDLDHLTELPNRRALDRQIQMSVEAFFRHKIPYTLAILDIDHFKRVNDEYGHQAGDAVLKEVARRVRNMLRKIDFFARYGGEEFAAIFPNTTARGAFIVMERIREALAQNPIQVPEHSLTVTISAGICEMDLRFDENEWVRRADEALYAAKRNGRNQVVIASEISS